MRQPAHTLSVVCTAFVMSFVMAIGSANAQPSVRVLEAEGRVYNAAGAALRPGVPLEFNQQVFTSADGFAIVRIVWQTSLGPCQRDSAFGFGASFTPTLPPPACDTRTTLGSVNTQTRFALDKPDGRSTPPPVRDPDPAAAAAFEAMAAGMGPLLSGQNRVLHDLREVKVVPSAGACALLCARDLQCKAMTYLPGNSCFLKDDASTAQSAPGAVSAIKRGAARDRAAAVAR